MAQLMKGARPERPSAPTASQPGFWEYIEQCWSAEPSARPSSHSLVASLPLHCSVLTSENTRALPHFAWKFTAPLEDTSPSPVGCGEPLNAHPPSLLDPCILSALFVDQDDERQVAQVLSRLHELGCPGEIFAYAQHHFGKRVSSFKKLLVDDESPCNAKRSSEASNVANKVIEINCEPAQEEPDKSATSLPRFPHVNWVVHPLWFRHAVLAILYFGRSLLSEDPRSLEEIETLLRALWKSRSLSNPPLDPEQAGCYNTIAAYFQDRGTICEVQDAAMIRTELFKQYPCKYFFDLAYTLLYYTILVVSEECGTRFMLPNLIPTSSRAEDKRLELVNCFTNQANQLYTSKRQDHNFKAMAKAAFHQVIGDTIDPDLARSLINLSNRLSDHRRNEDALEVTKLAVQMWRKLADRQYQLDLYISLLILSDRYKALNRLEESREAEREAVRVDPSRSSSVLQFLSPLACLFSLLWVFTEHRYIIKSPLGGGSIQ